MGRRYEPPEGWTMQSFGYALEHGQPAAAAVAIERSFGARRFEACEAFTAEVNARVHRVTRRPPVEMPTTGRCSPSATPSPPTARRDRSRRRRPWRRCGRSGTGRRTRWRPIRAPGRRGGRGFPKRCSTTASPERWTATGTGRSRGPAPGPGGRSASRRGIGRTAGATRSPSASPAGPKRAYA